MKGEKNRQKLADSFLRPTLWIDYCEEVSPNNCSIPDGVAERAPEDEEESNMFFLEGLFTGHFRMTDTGNCTLNPTTCSGHVVDYPCGYSSYVEPLFYHLNIALSGDIHEEGARGHGDWQVLQIVNAANATKANIILMWAMPDPFYQQFVGTEMELIPIILPTATGECLANRRPWEDQCSGDMAARVGDARGACDEPPTLLHKLVSTSLTDEHNDPDIAPARKSPTVTAIQQFTLTSDIYGSFFDLLIERDALQESRTTMMRDATCQWVVDNFDLVKAWIPFSYPRVVQVGNTNEPLLISSAALASVTILCVLAAAAIVHASQHRRVMQLAQIDFLCLLLAGLLFISIGALIAAIPPTNGSCIAVIWLVNVGYTLELAPLLVKVAAINQLMKASTRMQKINVERKQLFGSVFIVTALVIIFLIVWTAVDAPQKQPELSLSTSMTERNETIIYQTYYCSSEVAAWQYVAFGWTCLLLFSSSVLAFQMRNVRQEFNESTTLAMMSYSHFVFTILRLVIFSIDGLGSSDKAGYLSILLSVDSLAALVMYFLPKFWVLQKPDQTAQSSIRGSHSGASTVLARANNGMRDSAVSQTNGHQSHDDLATNQILPVPEESELDSTITKEAPEPKSR
jgi:7 transmembrane sweet-taste receptor of 3 GCPR